MPYDHDHAHHTFPRKSFEKGGRKYTPSPVRIRSSVWEEGESDSSRGILGKKPRRRGENVTSRKQDEGEAHEKKEINRKIAKTEISFGVGCSCGGAVCSV